MNNCIFCNNILDNSDEHIIPKSINGKLHSKEIICSICNSSIFGKNVDPVLSKIFKTVIHALNLKSSKALEAVDEYGNKYLISKNGQTHLQKAEIKFKRGKDGIEFNVNGDKKELFKYFEQRLKRFDKTIGTTKPLKLKKFESQTVEQKYRTLIIEDKFEINNILKLALYKIALEFYAYKHNDLNLIKTLLKRVHELDENLDEIFFCNFFGEVRMFEEHEVTHLIVIRSDSKEKMIYCYIELFNIICAFIPLVKNYSGNKIDYSYRQDCITGEKIDSLLKLNINPKEIITNKFKETDAEFSLLTNMLFLRHDTRCFENNIKLIIQNIAKKVREEIDDNKIKEEDYNDVYLKRSIDFFAAVTLYDFPYLFEDENLESKDFINYLHSNLNDSYFNSFVESNSHIVGTKFEFDNGELFTFRKFVKIPLLERNNIKIVKVFCLLTNEENMERKYIPYYQLFESIIKHSR